MTQNMSWKIRARLIRYSVEIALDLGDNVHNVVSCDDMMCKCRAIGVDSSSLGCYTVSPNGTLESKVDSIWDEIYQLK